MSFVLATNVATEKKRVSWRICNNSEIHSWLWKVWSLVVCSQSCFYVTKSREDDKNRQTTPFLLTMRKFVPEKQLFINVPFQSTKYKKNWGSTTMYKIVLEMCIVQHVEMKSVFTIQPNSSFYHCKKSKACCHVLNIPFKDQKPTIMLFWWWWYNLICKKNEPGLRKRETISICEEIPPPITIKHTRTRAKKGKNNSIYGMIVSPPQ